MRVATYTIHFIHLYGRFNGLFFFSLPIFSVRFFPLRTQKFLFLFTFELPNDLSLNSTFPNVYTLCVRLNSNILSQLWFTHRSIHFEWLACALFFYLHIFPRMDGWCMALPANDIAPKLSTLNANEKRCQFHWKRESFLIVYSKKWMAFFFLSRSRRLIDW